MVMRKDYAWDMQIHLAHVSRSKRNLDKRDLLRKERKEGSKDDQESH